MGPSSVDGGPVASLTDVHVRVLQLAAHGNTDQAIAEQMGLSRNTVLGYWKALKPKLGAEDRTHAVAIAIDMRLIALSPSLRPRAVTVKSTSGRIGELLTVAESQSLSVDEALELRALVASLDQARRSAGGLQNALSEARTQRDRAVRANSMVGDRLRDLVGRLPETAGPLRSVLLRAADDLLAGTAEPAVHSRGVPNAPHHSRKRTS
ncbi:response regulator transcription factor [Streptomyces sp. NPDC090499]|uniref:response regulator transcription factor n=1 Tax=Streptomyces sp. NPDC090499 TaxID=3365965 RepID=UPI0037F1990A